MNQTAVEKVITYVQNAIENRELLPGDRLPSERKLAEQLSVSRTIIRQSIQKLEHYGIVRTQPQSGTFVATFSKQQLDSLINNEISVGRYDFESLVQARVVLEAEALRLCALNRTEKDLEEIVAAFVENEENMHTERRQETDVNFHLTIAKGAHNPVIHAMLMSIIPDTLKYYEKWRLCRGSELRARSEHREMVDLITTGAKIDTREIIERHLLPSKR